MMNDFEDYQEYEEDSPSENLNDLDVMPPLPENDNTLDYEYQQAKDSIDFSRNEEEQAYWQKRANELWEKRDEADFKRRNT